MLTAGDLVAAGCSARPPGSGPQAAGVLGGGAAPSQGCPPHEAIREVPLTRLTVGMWTSRRHRACQLLLLEQESLLVVLVDRRAAVVRSPSRFLEGLTAASPFASAAYSQAGCVHAFEVPFASIRGLDYNNPLCLEARLVLETSGLRKREFPTMEAARAYFLQPAARAQRSPGATAPASTAGGAKPPAGQLHAALQSQAPAVSGAATAGTADGVQCRCQQEAGEGSRNGRSSARGSLALRLDGADAAGGVRAASTQPPPAPRQQAGCGSDLVPLDAVAAAAVAAAVAAPARPGPPLPPPALVVAPPADTLPLRDSLDDNDDDFESEFGSLWYWGSPARSSPPTPPRAAAQAERGVAAAACSSGGAGGASPEEPAVLVGSAPSSSAFAGFMSPSLSSPPQLADRARAEAGSKPPRPPPAPSLQRAASDGLLLGSLGGGILLQHQQHQQRQAAVRQGEVEAEGWPSAHHFTTVSRAYSYRTVCLHWTDPRLPGMLRPIIQGNEQLLKLYESGLPAWAVYAPQYGLFYRPWLRSATWVLFYAFSVFSFVMGFYDLYKCVPGLQVVMQRLMSSVWLPPAAVLEWLEQHTQIRLSILLTYLFGRSESFVWVMRWAHNFARVSRAALRPVADALGPPAAVVGQALALAGGQAWQALAAAGLTLAAVAQAGLAPAAALLLQCWAALGAALLPLAQALQGPLLWLGGSFQQLGAASMAVWRVLAEAGAGIAAGGAALAGAVSAGRAAGGATSQAVASQAVWLYVLPVDALEVVRSSAVKAAKSAQAVAKFCLHMCDSVVRHRLTLELRAGRAWRRAKQRLRAAALAPLMVLAVVAKWLIVTARLLVVVAEQDQPSQQQQQQQQQQLDKQQDQQDHEPAQLGSEAEGAAAAGGGHITGSSLTQRRTAATGGGQAGLVGGQLAPDPMLSDAWDRQQPTQP